MEFLKSKAFRNGLIIGLIALAVILALALTY